MPQRFQINSVSPFMYSLFIVVLYLRQFMFSMTLHNTPLLRINTLADYGYHGSITTIQADSCN